MLKEQVILPYLIYSIGAKTAFIRQKMNNNKKNTLNK